LPRDRDLFRSISYRGEFQVFITFWRGGPTWGEPRGPLILYGGGTSDGVTKGGPREGEWPADCQLVLKKPHEKINISPGEARQPGGKQGGGTPWGGGDQKELFRGGGGDVWEFSHTGYVLGGGHDGTKKHHFIFKPPPQALPPHRKATGTEAFSGGLCLGLTPPTLNFQRFAFGDANNQAPQAG